MSAHTKRHRSGKRANVRGSYTAPPALRRARGPRPATVTLPYRCTCREVHAVTGTRALHAAQEIRQRCPEDGKNRVMRRIVVALARVQWRGAVK